MEDGSVELLEFTWPPVSPDDSEDTLRASCLCLPSGFVPADVLRAGEEASAGDLVGLSTGLSVPPISLTDEGDWVRPTDATPVPALVLDLSDAGAECLAQGPFCAGPAGHLPSGLRGPEGMRRRALARQPRPHRPVSSAFSQRLCRAT